MDLILCRWYDTAKLCLNDAGYEVVDRIHMAEDEDRWFAVVKVVMHLRTPLQARNIFFRLNGC